MRDQAAATTGPGRDTDTTPTTTRRWPAWLTVVAMASLPWVTLFANNVGQGLRPGPVVAWWAATLAVATAIVAVAFTVSPRAGRRTAVAVAVLVFAFTNFPPLVDLHESIEPPMSPEALWGALTTIVVVAVWWVARFPAVQLFASIAAPALLLSPVVTLVTAQPAVADDPPATSAGTPDVIVTEPADVWYFVLDGHGSADLLRERTNYDPSPFLDHLRGTGFAIPDDSYSNYPLTNLSVSSALDMEYVYEGFEEPDGGPYFRRLMGHNTTVDILLANGYDYVHAHPNFWGGSRCSGREDVCIGDHGHLDDTQWALAAMTPLVNVLADNAAAASVATSNDPLHATRRALAERPDGPTFHFVHMLNPHPPLLRDADCNVRDVELRLAAWGDGPEYGDAVQCLHSRLATAVDEILAHDEDPIIVIQGDHGPRFGIDWNQEGGTTLDVDFYFDIFSAVRLPAACDDVTVPDDLSPVNTFRLVFACLTDTEPDLLEYRRFPIHRP